MRDERCDRLRESVDACLIRERRSLHRRLRRLRGRRDQQVRERGLGRLEARVAESLKLIETRRQLVPQKAPEGDLPVLQRATEIESLIRNHQVCVVCGETGSGKTTQIPQLALRVGRGIFGMIGHTQPRRLAARAVAQRLTDEMGITNPPRVGFQVRFKKTVEPATLIKVMTDGILLAELAEDPRLEQYDTLIIDEAHERSLNIDLLLGALKQILPKRPELRVIVTSATIDASRFSEFFDGAPVLEISGRQFDVDIVYRPEAIPVEDPEVMARAVTATMREVIKRYPESGDVLVFLPGEREIREVSRVLQGSFGRTFEILPLYARLSLAAQRRALRLAGPRRIVLATNVAETSLTVPRIRAVIDVGLARVKRFSARRGIERLPIEGVSKASARQRAGRAGRVAPGTCFRLYPESALEKRDEFTAAEILRTNLAAVMLRLADLGLGSLEDFPLLDRPRGQAIRAGETTLHELGALNPRGALTSLGRRMAALPVDPRLARMLVAGAEEGVLDDVLAIASGLAVPDPRVRPPGEEAQADRQHGEFVVDGSDFLTLRNLWREWVRVVRRQGVGNQRRWCQEHYLSWIRMREWREIHDQLRRMVREAGWSRRRGRASDGDLHQALLTGLVRNIGGRARPAPGGPRPEKGIYEGTGRKRFKIHPSSALARSAPAWIMAAELVETNRLWARTVAQVDPAWIESVAEHLLEPTYGEPYWDSRRGAAMNTMQLGLEGLTLPGERTVPQTQVDPVIARELFIEEALVRGETLDLAFHQHNRRLQATIERQEDRLRRRDLLAGEVERAAFYDTRLPGDVVDMASLKRWLRRASGTERRSLEMTERDLLRQKVEVAIDHFPPSLRLAGVNCPVRYGFDPGTDYDGLCVSIPLAILSRVDPAALDWLVPGLLPDKIETMIRGLEKETRRQCQPIAETVEWCVSTIRGLSGNFIETLAERLRIRTGREVTAAQLAAISLPPHLRASIEVTDGDRVIAHGRDLPSLIRKHASKAEAKFSSVAAAHPQAGGGHTSWTFGALFQPLSLDVGGQSVAAWTALIDEGDSVRVFLTESMAEARHRSRRALARLFLLATQGSIEFQIAHLPDRDGLGLAAAPCLEGAQLEEGLAILAAERIFLSGEHLTPVTTAEAFTDRLERGWGRISEGVITTAAMVREVFDAWRPVAAALEDASAAGTIDGETPEMRRLARLFPADLLLETPQGWLAQYPRWLGLMTRRLDATDALGSRELAEWDRRLEEVWAGPGTDPTIRQFQWLLEEFRFRQLSPGQASAVEVTPETLRQQWSVVQRLQRVNDVP